MPYICKVENVAGLAEAVDKKINGRIKYKIIAVAPQKDTVAGEGYRDNWINLGLASNRYQVVSVSAVESPSQNSFIFIPYYAYNNRWRARVFNSNGFVPVTEGTINAIVTYIDFGAEIDTGDVG